MLIPKITIVRWGIWGTRLKWYCGILLLCVIILAYTHYKYHKGSTLTLFGKMFQGDISNIIYCNSPGSLIGSEGKLFAPQHSPKSSKLEDLTLVQLQFVIRHGDRAPIIPHVLPNTAPVAISCKFAKQNPDYQEKLSGFHQKSNIFQIHGAKQTHKIISERSICQGGQLTPMGFLQHIIYGEYFAHSYQKFLEGINIEKDIMIRSTDYGRTIQSAAALLYGLFGNKLPQKFHNGLKINVVPDEMKEAHFLLGRDGKQFQCPALKRYSKTVRDSQQFRSFLKNSEPCIQQYVKLLNTSREHIPSLNRIVDILYTRLCHQQSLPTGPNDKVSFQLAESTFQLAHEYITAKHTQASDLQTTSLISQLVQNVDGLTHETTKKSPALVIYSGHDTVIVPLLINLGAHDGKWPPYASRVIFEIWYDSSGTVQNTLDWAMPDYLSRFKDHFVKVLYNGNSITKQIKFCAGNMVLGHLCPLINFVKFVTDGKFQEDINFFSRLERICTI